MIYNAFVGNLTEIQGKMHGAQVVVVVVVKISEGFLEGF
jgi:hypothetical protein